VLILSRVKGSYCVLYKNPLNMTTEYAEALLAGAEKDDGWVTTKANKQKWYCKSPCTCKYFFGGKNHDPYEMPQFLKELLEAAVESTTTNPPTNHVFTKQPTDCQQANVDTANLTPDFDSVNCNLHVSHSSTPQHSDDEPLFRTHANSDVTILSINIGATKIFALKDKASFEEIHFALSNGDILYMEGQTQKYCTHEAFANPTAPSQYPDVYGYPTPADFSSFGGRRLNITGRHIHTHNLDCTCSETNPLQVEWLPRNALEMAEDKCADYLPVQSAKQATLLSGVSTPVPADAIV